MPATEVKEGDRCPQCGTRGETAVHQHVEFGTVMLDFGWRCPKCGFVWGFELEGGAVRPT